MRIALSRKGSVLCVLPDIALAMHALRYLFQSSLLYTWPMYTMHRSLLYRQHVNIQTFYNFKSSMHAVFAQLLVPKGIKRIPRSNGKFTHADTVAYA